ncbi:MAG TPA: phosphonopyruvate decarboxylase [Candidatus Paceibacterota bacterium]
MRCEEFYYLLQKNGISFFAGVPDSLLKEFITYVADHSQGNNHIITANEGGAIALAAGHYLASGKPGLVYMQNSGEGNAINPLASLADPDVYSIPMLLLIGWRGEPGGVNDEPQHKKQGKITLKLLETLDIPYKILQKTTKPADAIVKIACRSMRTRSAPYALVVKQGTFEKYVSKKKNKSQFTLSREEALEIILSELGRNDVVISTTGKTSRELFELRKKRREGHTSDFLAVGSMGHASHIALGVAISRLRRNVFCFDGDGALIMHMGALVINGTRGTRNFKHVVFNNGSHESVGGQPTAGFLIDIPAIARSCGYKSVMTSRGTNDLRKKFRLLKKITGPALLEVKVRTSSRPDLGRPTLKPQKMKREFMKFL